MVSQSVPCHVFPARTGLTVIAVRVDRNAASRSKFTPDFDVFRIHQFDQVFHDDIHAVFMEVPMISEAEQVKFERFTFYHFFTRDVGNIDCRKIRLAGNRTEAGKFRTVEFNKIVVIRVFVVKTFKDFWCIVHTVIDLLAAQMREARQFVFISSSH